jgi:hypothetical protein
MTRAAVIRNQRVSVERAAAELAWAIREGDATAVDRWQQELVRLERSDGVAPPCRRR